MKATVFVEGESEEPTTVEHDMDTGITADPDDLGVGRPLNELLDDMGLSITDVYMVSEYSLNVAVWALQSVFRNSRCHQSRVTARSALLLIGETTDIETDGDGMPEPVKFPGKAEDHTSVQFPWGVG